MSSTTTSPVVVASTAATAASVIANASVSGDDDIDCSTVTKFDSSAYRFWCTGVLVSIVALVGLVGNLLAMVVLSRPKLRDDVFHQLLFALACFDLLYITCGGINYTFRAFDASSDVFTVLFPHFIHPVTHVAMAGTIFTTLAISIERYLGLCHPLLPPQSRKTWFYIVPVVIVAVLVNVPKFLEVKLEWNSDGVPSYTSTSLRFSESYIRYYIMWTRLFSTAVIPVTALLFLNTRIVVDLCRPRAQRFGSNGNRHDQRRVLKEINTCLVLLCIVLVFLVCHAARITLDVYEFSNLEKIIVCTPWRGLPAWVFALTPVSHFLMVFNSSVNFFIYCLVGHTFRRELCRVFGMDSYSHVPTSVLQPSATGNSRMSSYNLAAMGGMPATSNSNNGESTPLRENRHGIIEECSNSK